MEDLEYRQSFERLRPWEWFFLALAVLCMVICGALGATHYRARGGQLNENNYAQYIEVDVIPERGLQNDDSWNVSYRLQLSCRQNYEVDDFYIRVIVCSDIGGTASTVYQHREFRGKTNLEGTIVIPGNSWKIPQFKLSCEIAEIRGRFHL